MRSGKNKICEEILWGVGWGLLYPITPFWQCWLIPVTLGTIKLRIVSMTPQSTSQSTLMKPELIPTVHCNPLHPSSHLILSMDIPDNLDNPGLNTDQPPSVADQGTRESIPALVFWASTNIQWACGHPPLPTGPVIGLKPTIGFHQTLTLFPLRVIISHCLIPSNPVLTTLVHTLDSFTLASLYPPTLGYNS